MFKRLVSRSALFLTALIVSFALCVLLSSLSYTLYDGDTLNPDSRNAQIVFQQTAADQLETTIHIAPSMQNRDLLLMISDIRSFSLSVNGKMLYRFIGTPATQRLHVLELQDEVAASNALHIQISGPALKTASKPSSAPAKPFVRFSHLLKASVHGCWACIWLSYSSVCHYTRTNARKAICCTWSFLRFPSHAPPCCIPIRSFPFFHSGIRCTWDICMPFHRRFA